MATLPTITERPGASPSPGVASVNPSPTNLGGALVQAGGEIERAGQIVARHNYQQDQIVAMDAANRLRKAAIELESSPEGYGQAKGSKVVGQEFVKSYQTKFDDVAKHISEGLSESQKQTFEKHRSVVSLQYQAGLYRHQAAETANFNRVTRENTVDLGMNDIAARPYDQATFDTQMLLMGQAVVATAKEMGLDGEALASFTKSKLVALNSKALEYRTSAMLLDSPMKAADFFREHELEFDPATRLKLGAQIKTTTDAQTSRIEGQQAYQSVFKAPDMGADFVKPYDEARVGKIVESVKAPSKYDALFQKYAKQYNVSPTELKLRAVAESGLNPNAVSPAGATGLMQFMPETAKKYGIDPNDPEQAIRGAALLMSQAGGTIGGDMSKVDRVYYGGSPSANGPNTSQYTTNLSAVRDRLYGKAQRQPSIAELEGAEGRVVEAATRVAKASRPGDAVYQDHVITEARKAWALDLAAAKGREYESFSGILGVSIGDGAAKSLSDLPPQMQASFASLSPEKQHSLYNLWKSNQTKDVAENPDNTRKYLELMGKAVNDPVAFKSLDVAAEIKDLPKSYQTSVLNAFVSIDKEAAKGADYKQALEQLRPQIIQAGIRLPTQAKPESKDYDAFTGKLRPALDSFVATNKRKPTQEELQKIAAPLFAGFEIERPLWNKTVKGFQVTPEDEARIISKIEDADRQSIAKSFRARYGRDPVESEIQQRYLIAKLHSNSREELMKFDAAVRSSPRRSSGVVQ